MRKEFLFKYLHDKRVEGVEASSEKSSLIKNILQLWESPEASASGAISAGGGSNLANSLTLASTSLPPMNHLDEDSLPDAPAPSRNTSYSSLCSLDLYNNSQTHPPNLAMILNRGYSTSSGNLQSTTTASDEAAGSNSLKRTESNLSFMDDSNDSMMQIPYVNPSSMAPPPPGSLATISSSAPAALPLTSSMAAPSPNPFVASTPLNGSVTPNISSQEAQAMADTFVKWYYELLNAHSSDFRPDHFFPDASAKICLQSNNRSQPPELIQVQNSGKEVRQRFFAYEICYSNPILQVYSALCEIVLKYKLTYNPNLCRDGVSGSIDPHGLVIINACGTLHNASTCCGTFQQQFGLVRDPGEGNNWKIKFTNASLVSKPGKPQAKHRHLCDYEL
jgi:hypothetical protein